MQLTEDFEELLKQAEEKYSPLQRAIEEVGPELAEKEGKRAKLSTSVTQLERIKRKIEKKNELNKVKTALASQQKELADITTEVALIELQYGVSNLHSTAEA